MFTLSTVYSYATHLDRITACRDEGLGFADTLIAIDRHFTVTEKGLQKMRAIGTRDSHGLELVKIPSFGQYIELPMDYVGTHARQLCLWAIRDLVPGSTAVVEIGSGAGDLITSLALEHTESGTAFIGTEVSADSLPCIDILAKIARVKVQTRTFDVTQPDFGFLPPGPVLIVVMSVLSLFEQSVVKRFLDAAYALSGPVTLAIFDHVGLQLPKYYSDVKPLPAARAYLKFQGLLEAIRAAEDGWKLERLIPDMTAKYPNGPISYFQLRKY